MKFPSIKASAGVKIATGIVASIVVVAGGFFLVQNVFTKASDSAPRDLIINGITTNGAKIAWTTDQETQGVVEYGSSPTSLNLFAPESQKQKNHSVDITLLSPATSYYFQIRIGETKFDNGGVPWTFSTKIQQAAVTGTPPPPVVGAATVAPVPPLPGVPVDPTSASAFGPLKGSSLRVNPSVAPTARPLTPTAYVIPTLPAYVCGETDCQKVCQKKGLTCSTQDWFRSGCLGKVNWITCSIILPTNTPTPTSTPTLTPTPTNTPTPTPTP